MEFNSKKFEQIIHGSTKDVSVEPYESSSGDPITIKNTVKDLGVFSTNDLLFEEHMKKIINSSKVVMGGGLEMKLLINGPESFHWV